MHILIAIVCTFINFAHASVDTATDAELVGAISELNREVYWRDLPPWIEAASLTVVPAMPVIWAALAHRFKHAPEDLIRDEARHQIAWAPTRASFYGHVGAGLALFTLAQTLVHAHYGSGAARRRAAAYLDEIRGYLALSRDEQFRLASEDPSLRAFVLDLAAWFRAVDKKDVAVPADLYRVSLTGHH